MSRKKLTYEEVKRFIEVESKSGCKLLSKEYINGQCELDLTCRCGNKYSTSFRKFKYYKKRKCDNCSDRITWTFEKVKHFVEVESDSKFLSESYNKSKDKYKFLCSCGNTFETTFDAFYSRNKRKCNNCSMGNNLPPNNSDSLRYDFNYVKSYINSHNCILLSNEYKNCKSKLKIICSCGNIFETTFGKFRFRGKHSCNSCSYKDRGIKQRKTNSEFLKEVFDLVGDNYTFMEEYKGNDTKLKVVHNKCGYEYEVSPSNFIGNKSKEGTRCPQCNNHILYTYLDVYDFISSNSKCELLSKKYEGIDNKIKIKCACGETFYSTFYNFKYRNKRQCRTCSNKQSTSERETEKILKSNNIVYETENPLIKTNDGGFLRFDFYLKSIIIECDGAQHFKPVDYWGGEEYFNKLKTHDIIKNTYCIDNNIPLIRIPYWEFNNIEYILKNVLIHYKLINNENNTYDKWIVNKYLVDSEWNHDTYLSWNDKDKRDIPMKRELIHKLIH